MKKTSRKSSTNNLYQVFSVEMAPLQKSTKFFNCCGFCRGKKSYEVKEKYPISTNSTEKKLVANIRGLGGIREK